MALFRASKGYRFSKDGTEETTWANFTHVKGSDPIVYEFETSDKAHITALRKLIEDKTDGYTDIVEIADPTDPPKRPRAGKAGAGDGGKGGTAAAGGGNPSGGQGGTGAGDPGSQSGNGAGDPGTGDSGSGQ